MVEGVEGCLQARRASVAAWREGVEVVVMDGFTGSRPRPLRSPEAVTVRIPLHVVVCRRRWTGADADDNSCTVTADTATTWRADVLSRSLPGWDLTSEPPTSSPTSTDLVHLRN